MSITKIIFEYLQSNRRLTVPALGTFLSKGESQPILFSEFMKEDDGVLRGVVSGRGVSELEAAIMIDRFVFDLRHATSTSQERLALPSLGYMRCEDGRNLIFEYDPEASVQEPLEQVVAEPKAVVEVAETKVTEIEEHEEAESVKEEAEEQPLLEVVEEQPSVAESTPSTPRRRKRVDAGMILAIVVLLGAIGAMLYGILVQWKMGNVTFGEEIDSIMYNIFG